MKQIVDENWVAHVMAKIGGAGQVAALINEQAERIAVAEEFAQMTMRENLRLKAPAAMFDLKQQAAEG